MRVAGFLVGGFGGFVGVYFAQLLVTGTALFGLVAASLGSSNVGQPVYLGLGALACYTLGILGAILGLSQPRTASVLMFLAAVGGLAFTIAVGPSASNVVNPDRRPAPNQRGLFASPQPVPPATQVSSDSLFLISIPFIGPGLLVVGALVASLARDPRSASAARREEPEDVRTGRRHFVPAAPTSARGTEPAPADVGGTSPETIGDYRAFHSRRMGTLRTDKPEPLLENPATHAKSMGRIVPGVRFELLGETQLYFFVRVAQSLEGWLAKQTVREDAI